MESTNPYKVTETLFNDPVNRPIKVISIGCGISGIMMAYKLQKEHNTELVMFDKNADLGGAWFENKYPGVGCDVPSHAYSFNFALNPDWPNYCSYGKDVHSYLNKVCEVFDLRKYMRFHSEVVRCEWQENTGKWKVEIQQKQLAGRVLSLVEFCDILLYATGPLNKTKWPKIEGLKLFKGKVVIHTSAWPEGYQKEQWSNERIAIIGSGASSLQAVPAMQPYAKSMEIFVRSGSWFITVLENNGIYRPYSMEERQKFREDPKALVEHVRDIEKEFNKMMGVMISNSEMQTAVKQAFTERMRAHIKDDRLYNGFIPKYAVGCRRITPGDPYMKAIQEPNVNVHFTAVKGLTKDCIVGEDGTKREVDTIICATGFDTGFRPRFPIIGKNKVNLADEWKNDPDAYFGLAVPNMPNFFIFMGPAWPSHNGSVMGPLGQVGNYVVECIRKMQQENIKSLTPRADATAAFNIHVQEWLKRTVWTENCSSWYKKSANGRINALWPGSALHYTQAIGNPRFEDYHIEYEHDNPFAYLGNGFTLAEKQTSDLLDLTPFLSVSQIDPKWITAMQKKE